MRLSAADYFRGALLRLDEAQRLYEAERFVGAVYLGGRAVEALLRAMLWLHGGEQEIGHDLRKLLRRAGSLGLPSARDEARILDSLQVLAPVWHNNLRYADRAAFERLLRATHRQQRIGALRIRGDFVRANAKAVREACEAIVARGRQVWKRSSPS
jgi:HEPN domain-containing protein